MTEKISRETHNIWEMKPPFMMLKSTPGLFQSHALETIVPGKLADESQLGQLTSLFSNSQQVKTFHAPKPPKKRYLEENYSQNKRLNPVLDNVGINVAVINKNSEIPIPEVKKKKIDENSLYPDVNPILPDVVPKNESKDVESRLERKSWRKKLLCWEKLEEIETPNSCDRLKEEVEIISSEVNNNNRNSDTVRTRRKPSRLVNNLCSNDSSDIIDSNSKPGRRGRARACKGQKYREFMWTNVMHQRRKSSRWELCQDNIESAVSQEEELHIIRTIKTDNSELNNLKIGSRSSNNNELNSIDKFYKKKKATRKRLDNKEGLINKSKSVMSSESPKKRILKRETSDRLQANVSELSSKKMCPITGSKKRKLRRQSIRRLEPGSNFKDTSVVEDSGLATLASIAASKQQMKLRSNSNI